MTVTEAPPPIRSKSRRVFWRDVALVLLATSALLWVFCINGKALFYTDTVHYIEVGERIIDTIERQFQSPDAEQANKAGGATGGEAVDGQLTLSRSYVFAIISGGAAGLSALPSTIIAQAALALALSWTIAGVMVRRLPDRPKQAEAAFLPLVFCAATALPFYVAYLMPDFLSALGILAAALIIVYAHDLKRVELAFALAVAVLAAWVHLSHLVMIALLVPIALVVALLVSRPRWWLPPFWLVAVIIVGAIPTLFAAQLAERRSSETEESGGAGFTPFITARLVVDGPGMNFLDAHCPDPAIATCRLHEALGWSDDPMRLTATHIIFSAEPPLASYRLLPQSDRIAIASEQREFFFKVLSAYPVEVALALLKNTLRQAATYSIDMTLPSDQMIADAKALGPGTAEVLQHGRITQYPHWVSFADRLHTAVYAGSLVVLLWLLLKPGWRPDRSARLFAVVVLIGILANALVCGGISQPASRYGARVVWLIPYLAVLLAIVGFKPSPHKEGAQ